MIPRAMRMTIYVGGAASILVCLSLLLAVPDFGAVISGEDPDPVISVLNSAFGETGTKFVLLVVMISFLSCTLSLMAAASRLMYSYARDDMIFASHLLRHFDPKRHVPPYSMVIAASVPALIVLGSMISEKALTSIVSFAILGIYLGFQMVVLAALRARLKGWVPSGTFTLGRWGLPVTIAALTYGVLTMINIAWPRTPDARLVRQLPRRALGDRRRRHRRGLHGSRQALPAQRRPLRRRRAHPRRSQGMKFSYAMLPDYPLSESLASIKKADELGFYAVYAADETWHKDLWLLFAAAAARPPTSGWARASPASCLREPTLIAQAAATLDELTDGRAEVAVSSGNFGLLAQYHIDWAKTKPLSRVKEAVQVIRTLLDDGVVTFDGEFFNYSGLFTFARPVQERLPVKMGAMRGPKSFEVAAEFSDGCHHALSYTREAYDYMIEHCTIGAERAGKNVQDLDLGAWIVFSVAEDGAVAKDAARSMVGLYASSMPHEQLKRNGVDPEEVAPIIEAIGAGDMAKGIELTSPDLAERLSVAGTPGGVRREAAEQHRGRRRQPHDPGDHRQGAGQGADGPRGRGRSRHQRPAPAGARQGDARLRLIHPSPDRLSGRPPRCRRLPREHAGSPRADPRRSPAPGHLRRPGAAGCRPVRRPRGAGTGRASTASPRGSRPAQDGRDRRARRTR